jgi:GLPGLI family protein
MKKMVVLSALVVAGLSVTAFINPTASMDSGFEGVVTYSVITDGGPSGQTSQKERKIIMYIKGDKSKTVVGSGNHINTVIMDLNKPNEFILLMDANGRKYQLKNDTTKKYPNPVIKYVDGTKIIQGYTCHKAEITTKISVNDTVLIQEDVYYTQDILSGSHNREFRGLKGFPLEWITKNRARNSTTTAISIDKKSLSDDEFSAPPGYKLVTQEEMVQDMMKK